MMGPTEPGRMGTNLLAPVGKVFIIFENIAENR